MILTPNRGFAEWGEVFGDPVVAPPFSTDSSRIEPILRRANKPS
jgi:hypothetical protein